MELACLMDEESLVVCSFGGLRAAGRHWLRPKKTNNNTNSQFQSNKTFHYEWNELMNDKRVELME